MLTVFTYVSVLRLLRFDSIPFSLFGQKLISGRIEEAGGGCDKNFLVCVFKLAVAGGEGGGGVAGWSIYSGLES